MEILVQSEYTKPGRYTLNIPINPPESFTLVVGMSNDHGQYFEDIIPVLLVSIICFFVAVYSFFVCVFK